MMFAFKFRFLHVNKWQSNFESLLGKVQKSSRLKGDASITTPWQIQYIKYKATMSNFAHFISMWPIFHYELNNTKGLDCLKQVCRKAIEPLGMASLHYQERTVASLLTSFARDVFLHLWHDVYNGVMRSSRRSRNALLTVEENNLNISSSEVGWLLFLCMPAMLLRVIMVGMDENNLTTNNT